MNKNIQEYKVMRLGDILSIHLASKTCTEDDNNIYNIFTTKGLCCNKTSSKYNIFGESILISRRYNLNRIFYSNSSCYTCDDFIYLQLKNDYKNFVSLKYIYYYLCKIDMSALNSSPPDKKSTLSTAKLKNLKIEIVSYTNQISFLKKLDCLEKKINELKNNQFSRKLSGFYIEENENVDLQLCRLNSTTLTQTSNI